MSVNLKLSFECTMTPDEFRLVTRALRCVLTDDELKDAVDLAERLNQQRTGAIKSTLQSNEKLMANMAKNNLAK